MSSKTLYVTGAAATGPNWFSVLQDGGAAPPALNTPYGYEAGGPSGTDQFTKALLGANAVSSTSGATSFIDGLTGPSPGTGAGSTGDSFVLGPLTGTFIGGTWTFNFNVQIGFSSFADCVGRFRMRVWKSTNADGSGATELTTMTLLSSTVHIASFGTNYSAPISWSPGNISLSNEYLFFQKEWETDSVLGPESLFYRTGVSTITTSDFSVTITVPSVGTSVGATVAAGVSQSITKSAVGTSVGHTNANAVAIRGTRFPSAADIRVANQALGACRARTQMITSLDQGGPEATQIAINYTSTRDQLLRSFYWNFAKSTVLLGPPLKTFDPTAGTWSTSQPPPPWYYEYAMPHNCLKVRAIWGQNAPGIVVPAIPGYGADIGPQLPFYTFEVVTDDGFPVIVTNAPNAMAVITIGDLDPDVWDIGFLQAMIALLAADICMPLTGDINLSAKLQKDAQFYMEQARVQTANESTDIQHIMPDWIRARRSHIYDEGISVGGTVYGGWQW